MDPQPNYYAVIPANVRYDERLSPNAKLLYGELTALCNKKGYCWATNNYFAELYSVSKRTVSEWISRLNDSGHIRLEMEDKGNGNGELQRLIYINHEEISEDLGPLHPRRKSATPTGESTATPQGKKLYRNNKIKNNKKEKDISPEMKFQGRSSENSDSENSEKKNLPNDKIKNHHINFSKRILLEQQKRYPTLIKKIDHTKVNGGARILEQLERLDGYDFKSEIKPCLLWAIEDSFWSRNILSCAALRQKGKNGEYKFTNILNAWQRENNTTSTSRSGGAAIPVKRPWNAETTKPYEDFLEDPSPANLAQLYRNLQGIEKWVQGIDFEHYQRHTVVYNYYRRWKDYADKLLEWVSDQGWIGKHPSVFDVNGKIWKQFHSKYILPEIFMRDKIKMTWDKY